MPKLGQYKKREPLKVDPNEQFEHDFIVSTPHNDEFSRYIYYELVNTVQWNTHCIFETKMGRQFHFPGQWRITIQEDRRIRVECHKRFFDTRRGLRFNATRKHIIVG